MELLIAKVLTLYGPLGLGWIVAAALWWSGEKFKSEMAAVIRSNTEVITRMTVLLQERLPRK